MRVRRFSIRQTEHEHQLDGQGQWEAKEVYLLTEYGLEKEKLNETFEIFINARTNNGLKSVLWFHDEISDGERKG